MFDATEQKIINAALYYAKDPTYPELGANYKKLIAKMYEMILERDEIIHSQDTSREDDVE